MPRLLCCLLCFLVLSGCKIVTTDSPFALSQNPSQAGLLTGEYVLESEYGESMLVSFQPSGGMIKTGQGSQPSIAYSFSPVDGATHNRGELLATLLDRQPDWAILSVSGALAQVKNDGEWQADASAANYVYAAHINGDALNIYAFPKEAFNAPLSPPSPATKFTNAGVANVRDMSAFLTAFDYDSLLNVNPLFSLKTQKNTAASGLLDRNIPNAKKLYEDDSGVYYGAIMTFRDGIPFPSNKADQYLYVYSERKPLTDGSIIDIAPIMVQDSSGKSVPGYRYGASEINRAQQHIIPALKRAFPNEKRIQNDVMFRLFLDGYHGRWQGQPYGSSQAERAHVRLRFIKREGSYRPDYENLGKDGWPLEGVLNSAVQIKAAFPPMEPAIVAARMDNRLLYMAFKTKREQFKANQLDQILADMNKLRRPGIVYKTTSFWDQYPNFDDVRDIFDGNFDLIDHVGNFGSAYYNFARMYDAQCRQHLVNPTKRRVETWKEDEFGIPYDGDTYHYYIDGRFYDHFDKMGELADKKMTREMVNEAVSGFKNGDVFAALSDSLAAGMRSVADYVAMRRFINDHGCLSAPVQQLLDNLVAAPLGEPPVQASGKTYQGAAQASTAYVLADAERLYDQERQKSIREYQAGRTPRIGNSVIQPYLVSQLANDGFRVNDAMNKIGRRIEESAHPVLTCFYGPTRRTERGVFMYKTMKYWYRDKPGEWPAFAAAARGRDDIYPGLRHAVAQCPATLADAQALTGPISDQW